MSEILMIVDITYWRWWLGLVGLMAGLILGHEHSSSIVDEFGQTHGFMFTFGCGLVGAALGAVPELLLVVVSLGTAYKIALAAYKIALAKRLQ